MIGFLGRFNAGRWRALLLVMSFSLNGCNGGTPSSPSDLAGDTPGLDEVAESAAARSALSVSPKSVRLQCNPGFPCGIQVVVTSSGPVNLQVGLEGDFVFNLGATSCPLGGGTLSGSCTIGIDVGTTEFAGRRSGKLTISETTFGSSKTVRLAARVS